MINVGLIGFGLAGRSFHAPVINAVPGLRLAAILRRTGSDASAAYPNARIVRSLDVSAPRPRSVDKIDPETLAHRVTVLNLLKHADEG